MQKRTDQHHECGGDPAKESGEEKSWLVVLPDELVEIIIAKLPLPSLFRARLLSNSWNDKFFRLSKCLTPFQKEVNSLSKKLPTYSPALFGREGIRGFDRVTSQWKSLCTLFGVYVTSWGSSGTYSFLGSLTLAMSNLDHDRAMYVANVMTGSSTQLCLELHEQNRPVLAKILPGYSDGCRVPGDTDSFRVLLLYKIWKDELSRDELQTAMYDSNIDGWSVTVSANLVPKEDFSHCFHDTVYLHGKLYCIFKGVHHRNSNSIRLLIYHVDSDKTWTDHGLLGPARWETAAAGIFLCGTKVMVATLQFINFVRIFEVDLDLLRAVQVSQKLPEFGVGGRGAGYYKLIKFASDDDFIYCSHPLRGTPVLTYNVHSGEWGSLPPAFAPSLNFSLACKEKGSLQGKGSMRKEHTIMLGSAFTPGQNLFAIVDQNDAGARWSLPHAKRLLQA